VAISVTLALDLRAAGLRWDPEPGDRFVLPHRDMDTEVFVLSNMTIEVHEFPAGSVIGFNGVAEWALDSIEADEALWLPSEEQLRERLGGLFRHLHRVTGADRARAAVTIRWGRGELTVTEDDAAQAYGRALLAVLTEVRATRS